MIFMENVVGNVVGYIIQLTISNIFQYPNSVCESGGSNNHFWQINPALQPNSRFQGSKAAMSSGKVPKFGRVPIFHSCRFPGLQGCRFLGVPSFQSRLLDYQGSQAPSFQGSRFQASRFQTC